MEEKKIGNHDFVVAIRLFHALTTKYKIRLLSDHRAMLVSIIKSPNWSKTFTSNKVLLLSADSQSNVTNNVRQRKLFWSKLLYIAKGISNVCLFVFFVQTLYFTHEYY